MIRLQTLSQQFWSLSEQTKETPAVESVFGIVVAGWIGQLKFFKGSAIKDVFLIIFQNFHNSNFSSVLSKMFEEIFLEAFSWSNDSWLHYSPFSGKLPTISEYSKETFFLESAFADVRNSGLQAVALEKKAPFCKDFLGIFEILENPFPYWALSECISSAVQKYAVDYICVTPIKGNSTTYFFSDNFPKFSVQLF